MGKRVVLIGAGAVGGYVAGHMTRAGHDVTVIDPWPEHVEYMRRTGLELSGLTPEERFTVPMKALHITEVQQIAKEAPIDIGIVSTKSYDTGWATMLLAQYLAPDGFICSLQNCINEERIAAIVGWGRTVGCIASLIAAELTKPGHIQRNVPLGGEKHTVFRLGEPHGRSTKRVEELADMLRSADSAKVTSNLWGERWSKLVVNAMRNGLSAATGMSGNQRDSNDITRRFSIRIGGEAIRTGQAHGYVIEDILHLPADDWAAAAEGDMAAMQRVEHEIAEGVARRGDEQRPSMGQDMRKGRRTEIDQINGFVVEKAAAVGRPAPANAALVDVVKRVERGQAKPSVELITNLHNL